MNKKIVWKDLIEFALSLFGETQQTITCLCLYCHCSSPIGCNKSEVSQESEKPEDRQPLTRMRRPTTPLHALEAGVPQACDLISVLLSLFIITSVTDIIIIMIDDLRHPTILLPALEAVVLQI